MTATVESTDTTEQESKVTIITGVAKNSSVTSKDKGELMLDNADLMEVESAVKITKSFL